MAEAERKESSTKSAFLAETLGSRGTANYYRSVRFMAPLAARVVPGDAWYLSIIGILPSAQGRGLGASPLAGTLAEASQANTSCYLETFYVWQFEILRAARISTGKQASRTNHEQNVRDLLTDH